MSGFVIVLILWLSISNEHPLLLPWCCRCTCGGRLRGGNNRGGDGRGWSNCGGGGFSAAAFFDCFCQGGNLDALFVFWEN